jgi:phage portal protein BeeE
MGFLDRFRSGAGEGSDQGSGTGESEDREEDAVKKDDDVDRRASLDAGIGRYIRDQDGLPKPYDPVTLRDFGDNPVAQSFIDTLSQDAATASWTLRVRDDDEDVDDAAITDARRTLTELHPELTFRDLRELCARDLLELGDAAWVKHYTPAGKLAEAVPVNSARFYKRVSKYGLTEGYVQASFSTRNIDAEFELEEVVWFSWAQGGRENYQYGYGPVEKGSGVIDLLDELSDKEVKDLKEGGPSGIVAAKDSEDHPIPPEEFKRVDRQWELNEGQRHRHIVSRGGWDFTPISPNYNELQLLERSKWWVQVLGAIFKCNASYAGYDFQNTNRATDSSQQDAYAQRGFRVMLRYLEEAINRQLLWPDINEDLRFEFEREQTATEREERAQVRLQQGRAAEQLAGVGLDVSYRDDELIVDDGEIEVQTSEGDEGGGGSGGLPAGFAGGAGDGASGSEEAVAQNADTASGTSARALSKAEHDTLEEWLLDAHREQIQPRSIEKIEKRSWTGDQSVPEFVIERVKEAIDRGAVFRGIDALEEATRATIEQVFEDQLTQPSGWSLRSLTDALGDQFPGIDKDDLETVARTESAAVLNSAREQGYEERSDTGGDRDAEGPPARYRFEWRGPSDSRTTEACEELKSMTDGGVSMQDLKRMEREVHIKYFSNLQYREHVLHPNERHTFVRIVDV